MMSDRWTIHEGDCLEVMGQMGAATVSAVVTDPPYGLSFMGKDWDHGVPGEAFWREALRVTKPGGTLFAFGGTRTYHRLVCAIEDAGWEIADCLAFHWMHGQGFPKSHNIGKAIDKAAGHFKKRGVGDTVNRSALDFGGATGKGKNGLTNAYSADPPLVTELARSWEGYGTALKPAWEPIVFARKACEGSFAANAEKHGVAGLNIDAGRIGSEGGTRSGRIAGASRAAFGNGLNGGGVEAIDAGRWPANVLLDEGVGELLDEQSGELVSGANPTRRGSDKFRDSYGDFAGQEECVAHRGADKGGASRFFYRAKARSAERSAGLAEGERNRHPTVKPVAIMEDLLGYLVGMLAMPADGSLILDPFMGSGTTGVACMNKGLRFVGIEMEAKYADVARRRIEHAEQTAVLQSDLFESEEVG